MQKRTLVLVVNILVQISALQYICAQSQSGEQAAGSSAGQSTSASKNTNTVYVIRQIEFDIEGRSRPFALELKGELKEGERITGKDNFDKYLALKTQLLQNQSVLEEVRIEHFIGESEASGALPVRLLIHTKDSTNFVILPYPKYSSNDGVSITIKARDYNFFGTMTPLAVDLGYRFDYNDDTTSGDNEHIFHFSVNTDFPFRAGGLNWYLFSSNYLQNVSTPALSSKIYYNNATGLSLSLPWHNTSFTFGFVQNYFYNQERSTAAWEVYQYANPNRDPAYQYDPYGSTELYGSWYLPFGIDVGDFGPLYYSHRSSITMNYPMNDLVLTNDQDRANVVSFANTFGFGRIDWVRGTTYRKGLTVSATLTPSVYLERKDAPFRAVMDAGAVFHWPLFKYLGVSSRLKYRQWWHYSDKGGNARGEHYNLIPHYSAGDYLRGVPTDDLRAHQMLSLNFDLPIRLFAFLPSRWTGIRALRIFDCEVHFSPFFDAALASGPASKLRTDGITFGWDDIVSTTGFEVIAFSRTIRSIRLRGSVGYNIQKMQADGFPKRKWGFFPQWNEIFIGLDHEY